MYRVTRQSITRREGDEVVTYEEGDTYEPTDAELEHFGDRLEKVEEDLSDEEILRNHGIDPGDYSELTAEASNHDDIDGRQKKDELRKQLAEKLG